MRQWGHRRIKITFRLIHGDAATGGLVDLGREGCARLGLQPEAVNTLVHF